MKSRFPLACCLLLGLAVVPGSARGDLMLQYDVTIVQAGPVAVGSEIDWEIRAEISGAPNVGSNFGIAQLSVDLEDSHQETLSAGTIDVLFAGYEFQSGGTFNTPKLQFIGALDLTQSGTTVGDSSGSLLLGTGSYTVTQTGLHTLQAFVNVDPSTYFTAAAQSNANASPYDVITFGSDSIQVVPEPSSLGPLGLVACAACGMRRRRQKTTRRVSFHPA